MILALPPFERGCLLVNVRLQRRPKLPSKAVSSFSCFFPPESGENSCCRFNIQTNLSLIIEADLQGVSSLREDTSTPALRLRLVMMKSFSYFSDTRPTVMLDVGFLPRLGIIMRG